MKTRLFLLVAVSASALVATPAMAGVGDPIEIGEGATFDPIIDLNVRYESVAQDNPTADADAITARLRLGGEVKVDGFSFLAEGEGTLAILDDYNDTLPGNGVEPFSVVADPENIELNRLQIGYMKDGNGVTIGRQRINLDDQRFVGAVGWRQNEQTFDAVRAQAKIGPVSLDGTYAISQRTIFGSDSPNEHFDGDIVLLNAGVDVKPVKISAFAYLIDYDTRLAFSSATYGVRATAGVPLGESVKLNLVGSIATQSDMGMNPTSYDATFWNLEAGVTVSDFTVKAGQEVLGSDGGVAAFQTPLATLHKFNGFADLFLTTPAAGLEDFYVGASAKFPQVKALPGLNLGVTYHTFSADNGSADYGDEFDVNFGFKVGPVGLLAKYANYSADGFGVDTQKFWLQAGIAL
jgi:hypothetical protein